MSTGIAIEHLAVSVAVDAVILEGNLSVPTAAQGVVLFAHGSGSSRHSPRNRYVADLLNESGLATLLIDLLTEDEQEVDQQTGQLRFDIPFLAKRLVAITEWMARHPEVPGLPIGHFGASTGADAELLAASEIPGLVRAVV
jgi:dienelactone hydrolase